MHIVRNTFLRTRSVCFFIWLHFTFFFSLQTSHNTRLTTDLHKPSRCGQCTGIMFHTAVCLHDTVFLCALGVHVFGFEDKSLTPGTVMHIPVYEHLENPNLQNCDSKLLLVRTFCMVLKAAEDSHWLKFSLK